MEFWKTDEIAPVIMIILFELDGVRPDQLHDANLMSSSSADARTLAAPKIGKHHLQLLRSKTAMKGLLAGHPNGKIRPELSIWCSVFV